MNLNAILFASAAENGKLPGTFVGGSLPAIIENTSNWKLTVYDADQTLTIGTVTRSEDEVTIAYSSAATGANQYVSAIITDSAGQLVRYGKLKATTNAADASGTVSLEMPAGFDANDWVLKMFSEQCNADYRTDYAGTLQVVDVPAAPTIAAISAPAPITDGSVLSLTAPAVTDNGAAVFDQGWQICAESTFAIDTPYNNETLDTSYNNWYLRYLAANSIGTSFSNSVQITVVPKSAANDILTFTLPQQTGAATIDTLNHSVNIQVSSGTVVTNLTPAITVSPGATINPANGAAQNFAAPVAYTVTAENGTPQDWTVNVSVAAASPPSTGNGGGGGGYLPPADSGLRVTSSGESINQDGISIIFPAGAVENDIRVIIEQISQNNGLSVPAGAQLLSRIMDIVKDKSGNFLKPVTITLSFDKSKLDADKYDIAIYYYDEDTDKWVALDNIKLNLANGKVSGDTIHFT